MMAEPDVGKGSAGSGAGASEERDARDPRPLSSLSDSELASRLAAASRDDDPAGRERLARLAARALAGRREADGGHASAPEDDARPPKP